MISDLVLLKKLPPKIRDSVKAYIGCIAGAQRKDEYLGAIKAAGFKDVNIAEETQYSAKYLCDDSLVKERAASLHITEKELEELAGAVTSIRVSGIKP